MRSTLATRSGADNRPVTGWAVGTVSTVSPVNQPVNQVGAANSVGSES